MKLQPVGVENENNFSFPSEFELNQNYPNPFNPSTVIEFKLPVGSNVSLKIFDVTGKEVVSLLNDFREAGNHKVNFEASKYSLSSGVYFYTLSANEFTQTKSMILLK
ncbi:MAG: T9SS type A sorting domain-containing protein [Ignavibacteriales bacterium]|nr:T9SS type A sorting domain-containing protein [Ignavibacteriales bacterium]